MIDRPESEADVEGIRKRHRRVEDEGWALARTPVHTDRGFLLDLVERLKAENERQQNEINGLREAIEALCDPQEGFHEEWDALVREGILVEVPADDAFRAWWGEDVDNMWTYRWSQPAIAHLGETGR